VIGFYVIMIAVLALSGAVGYTIFTSVQVTNALSLAERNASRLELTMSALRQVVVPDGEGRIFVPMGVPSISGDPTSRTALPDWVSGEAMTPWGADYAYCPYAPAAGTGGGAATVYGGVNYAVTVSTDDPVVYGAARDYVLSGARPSNPLDVGTPPEVLAFLISPSNNASAMPSCASVYWDGRAWLTSGAVTGSVRALTLDAMADTLSQAPRQMRRHVKQGGTGSGLTAGDPASLGSVLTEWRYLRPHRLTLVLEDDGGPIVLDPATIDLGAGPGATAPDAAGFGRHLVLEAAAGASPVLNGSAPGAFRAPSDLTVNGVDFGANLTLSGLSGSRILVQGAELAAIETGGADITLKGGVSVIAPAGATAPPVRVVGGSLSIEGAVTINASGSGGSAIRQQGGRVHVDGPLTVTTGGSAGLFEAGGYGEVSATLSGTVDLGAGSIAMTPYTSTLTVSNACADDALTCSVSCLDQRVPLSGTCSASAVTNVFLSGTQISEDAFICSWAQISEGSPDVTNPNGPVAPVATALCAPKR
jgi:hypothetical protein